MLHYRTDRRPHATRRWETVTGPYPVTASTQSALELADTIAHDLLRDDPEIRADLWQEDRRVVVVGSDPCQASIRIMLGGAALRATEWWRTFDDARRRYISDCKLRGVHDIFDAEKAWAGSHVRAALLARRPITVDPDPDGTDEQDHIMNFTNQSPMPDLVHQLAEQITDTSPTAAANLTRPAGASNLVATVLAEFLAGADYASHGWYRPARDPEPDPATARVYDGKIHYERVPSGWQAHDNGDSPIYTWQDIPAPLVINSTQPAVGSWRLTNPIPGGPTADWRTSSPTEVRDMLNTALRILDSRAATQTGRVDVAGVMWTPNQDQPLFLIRFGRPGYDPLTGTTEPTQQAENT